MTTDTAVKQPGTFQVRFIDRVARWPWWLIIMVLLGMIILYNILTSELYATIFYRVTQGIVTSVRVAVISYVAAIAIGLFVSLGRVSKNPIAYNLSTLYVQIIRGVPILVQIIYVAFVITPIMVELLNALGAALVAGVGRREFSDEHHAARYSQRNARDDRAGDCVWRLRGRDVPGGHRIDRARADGSGALAGHELFSGDALRHSAAGVSPRAAAAGQ